MNREENFDFDLLRIRFIVRMVRWNIFPYVFQAATLGVCIWLIWVGWGIGTDISDVGFLKILRKTNSSTLFVWGLWWPVLVLGTLALGRWWCTVCPMELVDHLSYRLRQHLGLPGLSVPRWMKAGVLILIFYLLLHTLVGGVVLHRVPGYTSIMLLILLGLALVSGLLFKEPRSFCRAFCPANLLLSVYGRITPIQLNRKDGETCRTCHTKDCMHKNRITRWDGRSCPSRVPAYNRRPGDACVLCFQCVKACPHDNVGFGVLSAMAKSRRYQLLTPVEAGFVFFASGFVTHELFTEIKPLEWVFHWPFERLMEVTGNSISWVWLHTAWYLIFFPALLWLLIFLLARLLGSRATMKDLFIVAATAAAPLVATAHAAKALAKLNSWGAYLPISFSDPGGFPAAEALRDGTMAKPGLLVPHFVIGGIVTFGMILTLMWAWRRITSSRQNLQDLPGVSTFAVSSSRVGVIVFSLLYISVLAAWPFVH